MTEPLAFATPQDWADWLATHTEAREVWLRYYKKGSGIASIDWQQAVVEALCWGWIDGLRRSLDDTSWVQRFTPRKPGSVWSQINRAHAERLIAEGRMQPAGLAQVEIAKANGRWEAAYSGGQGAEIPPDFLAAVAAAADPVRQAFAGWDARARYSAYYRLTTAKRPETRAKRMAELLAMLAEGRRP